MVKNTDFNKILIGVTFREFNGSENEKIQRLFIESIKKQTYTNWQLVVTVFNEKFVEQEIRKYGVDAVFYNESVANCKFSLSDVLANTIAESNRHQSSIILWTTCDVIFQPDFFEQIIRHSSDGFFAISHPHITYPSIDSLNSDKHVSASLNSGMDLMIMDGEIFRNKENVAIVNKYRFVDWGVFEHFLVGLGQLNKGAMINFFGVSNISKVENDRKVGAETNAWLMSCWQKNIVPFEQFINDYKLSGELFNLTYCHMQFSLIKKRTAHYSLFFVDYSKYFINLTRRFISKLVPDNVKNIFRKADR